MGVDTDGMGTFSGDVKIGYTPGCPESPYNCIIDSKGFRIGVGNGGTTYAFKVDSGGNVTAAGSLNLCNSLLYNTKKGLGLNNRLTVFNEGKLIFREESWNSETDNEQGSCGYIAPITDSAAPGIGINGMNINLSASRTLTLESYTSPVIVKGGLKLENDAVYLSRTLNNSGDAATMETVSCKINVNDNGQCVITNDFGTSVAVMNGSLSVPSKDDGKTDLGRSNARWKDVYSSTSLITTSDMNYKKETAPLNEKYERFFMKLMPVSFLFKDGDSGRIHIGFISQDVETAMLECGLTDLDFAGFCRDVKWETCFDENGNESYRDVLDEDGKPVYIYSLRYEEFIPLNTHMLQKCMNKINDLENRILNLQGGNF